MSTAVRSPNADAGAAIIHDLDTETGARTMSWSVWECPRCGRSYDSEVRTCIEDDTPLRCVAISLPFLWIG